MKNPKILKFIPVILKLKRCVSMQLKIFPYLLRYVPDQYKTQQMCDKVNLEIIRNSGTLSLLQKSRLLQISGNL